MLARILCDGGPICIMYLPTEILLRIQVHTDSSSMFSPSYGPWAISRKHFFVFPSVFDVLSSSQGNIMQTMGLLLTTLGLVDRLSHNPIIRRNSPGTGWLVSVHVNLLLSHSFENCFRVHLRNATEDSTWHSDRSRRWSEREQFPLH